MDVLINHCWCQDSNWGGIYSCRTIVNLEQYVDEDSASDEKQTEDWTNLIEDHDFFNKKRYERLKKDKKYSEESIDEMCHESTIRLKPEVLKWLNENVKNRKDDKNNKGWCVGSESESAKDTSTFFVYFHRQTDAMKFIKAWSINKKPLTWFNYFDNIKKELDLKTKRMKTVKEFK